LYVLVLLELLAESIPSPGAKMSVQGPKLEKLDLAPVLPEEFTVIVPGALAGEKLQAFALLLPEATTTCTPSLINA
jgi:hypothetical protein